MPFGGLFCLVFFLAVACAAITSLVNLYEPPIEALQQQAHLPRWAAVAIVALLRSSRFNAWLSAGLGLVLGGALGNLVDRIRFRAVIDFVDVYVGQWHWPAFNVADMAICVGAFLACIVIWRTPEAPEKSKEKKS